ncbi:hypothetical protein BTVI_56097 [Pitangus sulphuratus]|nr:hypothetical protein BTVI_56097 [Pitangus sulphuratus]
MVLQHAKAVAAALSGSVLTQTKPLSKDTAVQVSGCTDCLSLAVPEDSARDACVRCEQVNDLLCFVSEPKEEVERLRSIRESERELRLVKSYPFNPKRSPAGDGEALHLLPSCRWKRPSRWGEWKQVPDRRCKGILSQAPSPLMVPLKNRYEVLDPDSQAEGSQEEDLSGGSPYCTPSATRITATAI